MQVPGPLQPFVLDRWAIAFAGYVAAMFLYLGGYWLAVIAANHSHESFRDVIATLVAHRFVVLAPAALLAVVLIVVAPGASMGSNRSKTLRDLALFGVAIISAIVVVGSFIGVIVDLSYASRGFSAFVDSIAIHLAALIVGAVTMLWAWGELAPAQTIDVTTPPPATS
jgi:hypothetical protein